MHCGYMPLRVSALIVAYELSDRNEGVWRKQESGITPASVGEEIAYSPIAMAIWENKASSVQQMVSSIVGSSTHNATLNQDKQRVSQLAANGTLNTFNFRLVRRWVHSEVCPTRSVRLVFGINERPGLNLHPTSVKITRKRKQLQIVALGLAVSHSKSYGVR